MREPAELAELDPVIGTVSRNASEGMALRLENEPLPAGKAVAQRQAALPKRVEALRHAHPVAVHSG
jgi:hypothetical protein